MALNFLQVFRQFKFLSLSEFFSTNVVGSYLAGFKFARGHNTKDAMCRVTYTRAKYLIMSLD